MNTKNPHWWLIKACGGKNWELWIDLSCWYLPFALWWDFRTLKYFTVQILCFALGFDW